MHALKRTLLSHRIGSALATPAVQAGTFAPAAAHAHPTDPSTSTKEEGEG
jgi:hypothetical protein